MGALSFPQFPAQAVARAGSGLNPTSLGSVLRPVVGSTFVAAVDASAHGFPATVAVLIGHLEPLDPASPSPSASS